MSNKQATVTLTEESWKAIMGFINSSCQLKGDDWVKWGAGVNQIIQASIDKSIGESPVSGIKRTAILSGNLRSVGYDVRTNTLEIQFNDGSVYQYYQVPQGIYVKLMKAESQAGFFYTKIRNQFRYKKVGREPVAGNRKASYSMLDEDCGADFDYPEEFDPHDEAFGVWIDDNHWVSHDGEDEYWESSDINDL